MKITADLIQSANQCINAIKERELELKGYKISVIENMGATLDFFDAIDISDNEINKLGNFTILKRLKTLILNSNRIAKIQNNMGSDLPNLENLMLMNNKINDLNEIDNLSDCKKLLRLSLGNNLVTQVKNYRLYVIARIPSLRILDFQRIKKKERDEAAKLFGPNKAPLQPEEVKPMDKKERLKMEIEKATTLEEINRIETLLKSGDYDV